MPFAKGQSGNPGGRPKVDAEVRALAQEYGKPAILKLVEHLNGEDGRLAQAAAIALLDRGFGKPAQSISLGNEDPEGFKTVTEVRNVIVDANP